MKQDIRELSREALEAFLEEHGEKKFRAKQIEEWLWAKGADTFEEMSNLSKSTRELLLEHFSLPKAKIRSTQKSKDTTIKVAFELPDGEVVEGVLIPSDERVTACISSQVGCALHCKFCATGLIGYRRNLTTGEIYDQAFQLNELSEKSYGHHLSNIVYMGMGEPLMNYENVLASAERISNEKAGMGMSPQRVTVSTVGLTRRIKKLADDEVKFHLAVSLHAARDKVRNEIMPMNKNAGGVQELREAITYFHEKTKKRVTIEYVLLGKVNDQIEDAQALAEFCKAFPVKVNVIEYNPVAGTPYKASDNATMDAFVTHLRSKNMVVNVRRSRGKDIDAACGQLATRKVTSGR
ncbi:MAG: 23S rRNA (adenine(2503)-C(2))-methyltransferase RlmN [Bacteroidales bacterium]